VSGLRGGAEAGETGRGMGEDRGGEGGDLESPGGDCFLACYMTKKGRV
jgi:hypothetical protein